MRRCDERRLLWLQGTGVIKRREDLGTADPAARQQRTQEQQTCRREIDETREPAAPSPHSPESAPALVPVPLLSAREGRVHLLSASHNIRLVRLRTSPAPCPPPPISGASRRLASCGTLPSLDVASILYMLQVRKILVDHLPDLALTRDFSKSVSKYACARAQHRAAASARKFSRNSGGGAKGWDPFFRHRVREFRVAGVAATWSHLLYSSLPRKTYRHSYIGNMVSACTCGVIGDIGILYFLTKRIFVSQESSTDSRNSNL